MDNFGIRGKFMSAVDISDKTVVRGISIHLAILAITGIMALTGTYYSLAGEQDRQDIELKHHAKDIQENTIEMRAIKNFTSDTAGNVAVMKNEIEHIKQTTDKILERLDAM